MAKVRPGPARERPPSPRLAAAQYRRLLAMVWGLWGSRVMALAEAEIKGQRLDAIPRETLAASFEELFRSTNISGFLGRMVREMSARQGSYVTKVAKIPPREISTQQIIEEFRRRNVSLVTKLGDKQASDLADILRVAQATGERWEKVAPVIQERLNIGERRAKLIARDQTNKINANLQQAHQRAAGIEEYTWSTANDMAVRGRPGGVYEDSDDDHWRLNGKRFRYDDPPVVNKVTGERANPGEAINCRCVAVPYIAMFDDLGPAVVPTFRP